MLIKVLVMQKNLKIVYYMRSKGSDIIDYLNEINKKKVNNAESLFTSG
jgi:hypothetical protein